MGKVSLTKRLEFSASHRYHNEAWDEARNERVFGACTRAPGHGHNYLLEVTVGGSVSEDTGMVVNLFELKVLLLDMLTAFDHKHLNLDTPYFTHRNPTTENIATVFWSVLSTRRDLASLVALYDERVEIGSFAAAIEGAVTYRGHDGVRAWYRNLVKTLEMIIETGELVTYRHLVLSSPRIRLRMGGADTLFEQSIVYEVRDGRILRSLGYKDAGTGLVAMGRLLLGQPVGAAGLPE